MRYDLLGGPDPGTFDLLGGPDPDMKKDSDFFEEDEPVSDVIDAFNRGSKGKTSWADSWATGQARSPWE